MALVKLKTPVAFGHEEYDPVDVLVFLSATDQTAHIGVLAELMQLLEDDEFLTQVRMVCLSLKLLNILVNKNI